MSKALEKLIEANDNIELSELDNIELDSYYALMNNGYLEAIEERDRRYYETDKGKQVSREIC